MYRIWPVQLRLPLHLKPKFYCIISRDVTVRFTTFSVTLKNRAAMTRKRCSDAQQQMNLTSQSVAFKVISLSEVVGLTFISVSLFLLTHKEEGVFAAKHFNNLLCHQNVKQVLKPRGHLVASIEEAAPLSLHSDD